MTVTSAELRPFVKTLSSLGEILLLVSARFQISSSDNFESLGK
jgi:hypothetical protein